MNAHPSKLPLRTKLSFGAGSIAFGIKDQGFNALLMLYYNQVIGLPASWVGTAILIAMLVDAVLDPLIGHYSDRFRSRIGRRHPFMYASALPIALTYILFWSPPEGSQAAQFAWLLATSIAVRVSISFYEVPSSALMAELTTDYDERTSLSAWRSLFLALGLVGMGYAAFKIFLQPTPEQPVGQLNAQGYIHYSYAAALVMFLSVLIAARGTHARIPLLRAPTAEALAAGLWSNLRLLFTDRAYVSLVLCIFFFAVATGISTTLGTYIATYFWKLSTDQLAAFAGSAGLGVVVGLIVVGLSKRFDKKSIALVAYALALMASVLLVSLRLLGLLDGDAAALMPWLMLQSATVTACVLIGIVMAGSMLADVADHFELKAGRRMEGLMFAALIMIQKAVSGMGVFLSGLILSAIQFPDKADPATLDPAVTQTLGTIFVLSLGSMVSLALLAVIRYPINRQSHQKTLAALGRGAA